MAIFVIFLFCFFFFCFLYLHTGVDNRLHGDCVAVSNTNRTANYECNDINDAFDLASTTSVERFDIKVGDGRYDVITQLRSGNVALTASENETYSFVFRGNSPYNTRIQNFLDPNSSTPFIYSNPNGNLYLRVSNFTYNPSKGIEQKFGYFSYVDTLEMTNLRLNLNNRY